MAAFASLAKDDLVIDIGSNDGALLSAFQCRGMRVLRLIRREKSQRKPHAKGCPQSRIFDSEIGKPHMANARILYMSVPAHLVIGADSFIGSCLIQTLQERGHRVFGTTRRKDTLGTSRIFLDFTNSVPLSLPVDIEYVYIVAAATNYARCAALPESHTINTIYTPRLVEKLLHLGVYVSFVSSNTVFGGERPWPHEDAPHDARFPYAIQKDLAEKAVCRAARVCGAEHRLAIVRLTKVLDASTSPLPSWLATWKQGQPVRPFSDLTFAPISRRFAAHALAVIAEKKVAGALHVSGADNVTYVELAHVMAKAVGVGAALITPTTAIAQGLDIPFKPRFSGLGMARTIACTGLQPQKLDEVVAHMSLSNKS